MKVLLGTLAAAIALSASAQTNQGAEADETARVCVKGDRVSLRAAPSVNGDLLDRAMRGDELAYYAESNGWYGVQAPKSLDVWISAEFLQGNTVIPPKLNVRSGPSQNYPVVAVVSEGDVLEVRDHFNGWVKVAPPTPCTIWISADFSELINPPAPEKTPEATTPEITPVAEQEKPAIEKPVEKEEALPALMLVLDETREQKVYVELPGVLRRANPGLYKLVLVVDGWEEPICLVRGRTSQLESYLGRTIMIKGLRYWVKDVDLPVVQPEKIILDPIIAE